MKRLILTLSLAAAALSGCAQLKDSYQDANAHGGASGLEESRPYPRSPSNIGGGL